MVFHHQWILWLWWCFTTNLHVLCVYFFPPVDCNNQQHCARWGLCQGQNTGEEKGNHTFNTLVITTKSAPVWWKDIKVTGPKRSNCPKQNYGVEFQNFCFCFLEFHNQETVSCLLKGNLSCNEVRIPWPLLLWPFCFKTSIQI